MSEPDETANEAAPRPRVAVLLSIYNGERYLAEQLASLDRQTGVEVSLHARDDGSTDGTVAFLCGEAARWPQLAVLERGANLGVLRSFLALLASAPADAHYFAFCDQDDVWLPDKLERAIAAIGDTDGPALYCSNVTLVDDRLVPIATPPPHDDTRFAHLLFENIAIGCTVVLNRAARDLVIARDPGDAAVMHDWWCALVVAGTGGRIHYDPQPGILYRQHGGNVVGQRGGALVQAARNAKRFLRGRHRFYRIHEQAGALLALYGAVMPAAHHETLRRLVASKSSLAHRLGYALAGPVIRRRRVDAAVVRGLIAAGWY